MAATLIPLPPFPSSPMTSPRSPPTTLLASPGGSPSAAIREGKPSFRKRVSSFITRRRSPSAHSNGSPEPQPPSRLRKTSDTNSGLGGSPAASIGSTHSSPYLSTNQLPHEFVNGNANGNGNGSNGYLKVDAGALMPSLVRTAHLAPSPIAESPSREAAATTESPRVVSPRARASPLAVALDAKIDQLTPYVIVGLEPGIKEEPDDSESSPATSASSAKTTPPVPEPLTSAVASPPPATTAIVSERPIENLPASPRGLGLDLQPPPPPIIPIISEELVTSPPELASERPMVSRATSLHPSVIIVGVPDDAVSSIGDFDHDEEESPAVEVDYVRVLPEEEKQQSPVVQNGKPIHSPRPVPLRRLTNDVPKWVEETAMQSPDLSGPPESVLHMPIPMHMPILTSASEPLSQPSAFQRVWNATCGMAERTFHALPVSVPVLGVLAPSAEGVSTSSISRASSPLRLLPPPTPPLQGWTTYLLPDGREYYYHAALRSVSDVWPIPLPLPPPPGLELHISQDGERWVDHQRRVVWKASTELSHGDPLSAEVAYWAYVASHPAHMTLSSSPMQEAKDVLVWAQTDTALPGTRFSTLFTHDEAVELSALLRDAKGSPRTRLVARVLHRRASAKASMRIRARFRQTLPPLTLKVLFGALCIGLPLLLRSRARTGRTMPGALAFLAFAWPKSDQLFTHIHSFAATHAQ